MALFSLLLLAAVALCIHFFVHPSEQDIQIPDEFLPQVTGAPEAYSTDPLYLVQASDGVSMLLTDEGGAEVLLPMSDYGFAMIQYYFSTKRMFPCNFPFPFVPQYTLVFSNGLRVDIMQDDEYFRLNRQTLTLVRASSRPNTVYRTDGALEDQIWQYAVSQGKIGVLEEAYDQPFGLYYDNTSSEMGFVGCAYKEMEHYIDSVLYWEKGVQVTYSSITNREQVPVDEVPEGIRVYLLEYRIQTKGEASMAVLLQDPRVYVDRGWVAGLQLVCVFLQKEGSGGGNFRTYALGTLHDPSQWATPAAAGQAARSLYEALQTDAVLGNE